MIFLKKKSRPNHSHINSTSIKKWSNETSWVFPAFKSTIHFLPRSTVSHRSDFRSATISSSWHWTDTWSHLQRSIINIDSNFTDNIIRKVIYYSRKSLGPTMEPWGTPALTGYSCEDFLSRTIRSCLLFRKEEIRPNIWPKIP